MSSLIGPPIAAAVASNVKPLLNVASQLPSPNVPLSILTTVEDVRKAAQKFRDGTESAFNNLKTAVKSDACNLCKSRCGASAGGSKSRRRRHSKKTSTKRKSRRNHKKSRKMRKH